MEKKKKRNSVILNKTLQFPFKGDIWAQCGRQGRGSESRDGPGEMYAWEEHCHRGTFSRQIPSVCRAQTRAQGSSAAPRREPFRHKKP